VSSTSQIDTRRRLVKARQSVFAVLVLLATAFSSQAQIPVPAGTYEEYVYDYDTGTYSYGSNSAEFQNGYYIGYSGGPNPYGGGYITFLNPAGGSFGGQNWGGETFEGGSISSGTLEPTSFSDYLFQPAPSSKDFAYIGPLGTDSTNDGGVADNDGLAGSSEQEPYDEENYVYQGEFSQATSYTVDMGANTVAETVVSAGIPPADAGGVIEASPNINLSGVYTSTVNALVAGNDLTPVNVTGSSGGSLSTPFLELYGDVNVTGGKLSGDTILVDSLVDPKIDYTPVPLTQSNFSTATYVVISGSSSSIVSSDLLLIGRSSQLDAILSIANGATGTFYDVSIGCGDDDVGQTGSNGSLFVDDSKVTVSDYLQVGAGGDGSLFVQDGGTLITGTGRSDTETGAVIDGEDLADPASATVEGSGSSWTNTGDLAMDPNEGANSNLTINDSGDVSVSGEFIVAGIAEDGNCFVTIEDGGTLETGTAQGADAIGGSIGEAEGSYGSVQIMGAGSKWTVTSSLSIGTGGKGNLTLSNGGTLEVDGSQLLIGGKGAGTLTIGNGLENGALSTVYMPAVNGQILVGNSGGGSLSIEADAKIDSSELSVGYAGSGMLDVGGPGFGVSAEFTASEFNVGEDGGNGEVEIDAGGIANDSGGSLNIAVGTGSTGKVTVTGQGASLIESNINVGGTATTAGGTGSLIALKGGSVTATNTVTVQANSRVTIEAGSTLTAGDGIIVKSGGQLVGGGTIQGNVTSSGKIVPGDPQTMTIEGNYTQMAGGFLILDVDGNAAGDYDQLDVTGELSIELGATLELDFGNGFAPTAGETFNLVDYGSLDPLNAGFSSVDITGLAAGFEYTITPVGTGGTDFQLTALNNGVATTTPEPSTWVLFFAGMSLLALVSPRLRQKARPRCCR